MSVCKYCELSADDINKKVVFKSDSFTLFRHLVFIQGFINKRKDFVIGIDEVKDGSPPLWLKSIKVNYCPMCGRKLKEETA